MADRTSPTDERSQETSGLRTDVSHSARIWTYWLGGKDNYPVDQEVGDQILSFVPALPRSAVADRKFLARAVRYLANEAGIRQFLDVGSGLPTVDNTHEVAQQLDRTCRIVYVDNDPIVLTHAHALLTSTPEGATAYVEADAHDPDTILERAAGTLDFGRPIALMMLGVVNFIMDDDEARTVVRRLLDAVPSGSHLVISHPTTEVDGEAMAEAVRYWNSQGSAPMTLRTREELLSLFEGVDLVDPGVVSCSRWRPEPSPDESGIVDVTHFGGVARKP